MNFSEIKNLYKKFQLPITLGIGTFLFFVSTFWEPAIYIASVFILVSYIFSSIEDIFAYSFYFMLFSGVIVFYVVLAVGTFLVVFIKYIIDAIKDRVEVQKKPLLATTILLVLYSLIIYKYNMYGISQGFLIIGLMYLVYVMFCYRKQISIRKLFKVLCIGMIVTSLLSLILYFCKDAQVFVFDDFEYTFRAVKDKVFLDVGHLYKRLELFSYHPNHLASFCMFLIAYGIYEIINNKNSKKELIENCIMIAVGTIVGILTLSKAFFLIFIGEIGFVLLFLILHYKKKSLKFVLPILAGILIGVLIFHKQIGLIIKRILPSGNDSTFDEITTGRAVIWKKFIDELLSSPVKLIFGEGLFTTDIVDIGPHSIYVAILFRFGIVGTIALAGVIYTYVLSVNANLKFHFRKCLPILVFLIYSIQEANIDERFFFLILAIMLLFGKTDKDDISEFEPKQKKKKEKKLIELDINTDSEKQENSLNESSNHLNNENLEDSNSEFSIIQESQTDVTESLNSELNNTEN